MGIVHSWDWRDSQPHPSIYLKISDAAWRVEGLSEPGLYPVAPRSVSWVARNSRKAKRVKVTRIQIPLAPAYAMTVGSNSGRILPVMLLGLNAARQLDPAICATAIATARCGEDILILRRFPLSLYQRQIADGPQVLLRLLRGKNGA